jgi:hypothetical protein
MTASALLSGAPRTTPESHALTDPTPVSPQTTRAPPAPALASPRAPSGTPRGGGDVWPRPTPTLRRHSGDEGGTGLEASPAPRGWSYAQVIHMERGRWRGVSSFEDRVCLLASWLILATFSPHHPHPAFCNPQSCILHPTLYTHKLSTPCPPLLHTPLIHPSPPRGRVASVHRCPPLASQAC